ncbi:CLUMA_CG014526, isoform A [Clunio marinus]|uniref:CLUMA_CG014526, isoform A n=1 Tax=Clunio marinus TaxID=568069 RepID=A0A1J1IM16_9DIPT|nr:CLUMA_CG014526, isoform A [Clunio marinus]
MKALCFSRQFPHKSDMKSPQKSRQIALRLSNDIRPSTSSIVVRATSHHGNSKVLLFQTTTSDINKSEKQQELSIMLISGLMQNVCKSELPPQSFSNYS